jgi:hypothetical protein
MNFNVIQILNTVRFENRMLHLALQVSVVIFFAIRRLIYIQLFSFLLITGTSITTKSIISHASMCHSYLVCIHASSCNTTKCDSFWLPKECTEECWLNVIFRYILTTNLRLVTDYSVKNHQVVRKSSNSVYHVFVYVVLK